MNSTFGFVNIQIHEDENGREKWEKPTGFLPVKWFLVTPTVSTHGIFQTVAIYLVIPLLVL